MNTPMNPESNELVLQFAGGTRDGETVAVTTSKCVLGTTANLADPASPQMPGQCAIFRGPSGAAARTAGSGVSINGNASSVHWLQRGDQIQLPDSTTVEVLDLGAVKPVVRPSAPTVVDLASDCVASEAGKDAPLEDRLQSLEHGFEDIRQDSSQLESRFDRVEESLSDLTAYVQQLLDSRPELDVQFDPPSEATIPTVDSEICEEVPGESVPATETGFEQATELQNQAADSSVVNEQSIASLFSQLAAAADDESPEESVEEQIVVCDDADATETMTEENAFQQAQSETSSTISDLATADAASPVEFEGTTEEAADNDDSNTLFASESSADEDSAFAAGSLAEQLYNSIQEDENDAYASEPVAGFPSSDHAEVAGSDPGHGASGFAPPESTSQSRTPVPTESVSEIFARLQAENNNELSGVEVAVGDDLHVSDSVDDTMVETSYEAVEAEISAVMRQTVTETSVDADPYTESLDELTDELAAPESSSIADVLNRLTAAQQEIAATECDTLEQQPQEESASVESFTENPIDSEDNFEPVAQQPVAEPSTEGGESSVEDYMSQLLSRMRGNTAPAEPVKKDPVEAPKPVEAEVEEPELSEDKPLTDEEFRPKQVAAPIKSFNAMRELANSTTRSAIQRSIDTQRKERTQSMFLQSATLMGLILAIVSFAKGLVTIGMAFSGICVISFIFFCVRVLGLVPTSASARTKKQPSKPEDVEEVREAEEAPAAE